MLMIGSGLLMDVIVVSLFCYFLCSPRKSAWRIPLEFLLFYGLRFTCLFLFAMQTPKGFYWDYPGFPSLTVPYGWTNDFFYSGHIGACILCFCEFRDCSKGDRSSKCMAGLTVVSIVSLIAQVMVMLVTRGHYTIDLIAGVVIGHYCHLLAFKMTETCCKEENCKDYQAVSKSSHHEDLFGRQSQGA